MKMRNKIGAGLALVGVVFALSACDPTDSGSQPWNDAAVDKSKGSSGVMNGPAVIVNMPDGFSNVSYKCVKNPDGTWTMFSTVYHKGASYAALAVTPNAALCG